MDKMIEMITYMILNTDLDVDQVLEQAIGRYQGQFTVEQVKQAYATVLNELPELN